MQNIFTKIVRVAFVCALLAVISATEARAQQWSVSTNLVEWGNLGTINGEVGVGVSQHFSLFVNARYNNWTFRKGVPEDRYEDPYGETEVQFENRKMAFAAGVRFWPWYTYSGWWLYLRGQYMEYNRGGLIRHIAEEGDAYGGGVGFGYTYMLHKNWNIEFGAGVWAGYKDYKIYRCTNCGGVLEDSKKFFFLPDDVFISLIYVF